MNRTGIFAGAALLALAGGVLSAPLASATAPPPTLHVSPTTVQAGGTLNFKASCYGHAGPVTSPGLVGAVALQSHGGETYTGTGKAGEEPGTYTATFSCAANGAANGTASVRFTIVCTPPTKPTPPTTTTKPTEPTEPTEPTTSSQEPPTQTTEPSTSTAAVAPAALVRCGSTGPGSTGSDGSSSSAPQVQVLPKGAPETGDGSEAAA